MRIRKKEGIEMKRGCMFLLLFAALVVVNHRVIASDSEGSAMPMAGYYGFGDYHGQRLSARNGNDVYVENENVIHFAKTRIDRYSGWSRPVNLSVGKDSLIIVKIRGAVSAQELKFLKLFVGLKKRDVSLLCTDAAKQSPGDPVFIVPCNGDLKFRFLGAVLQQGAVDKFGFTFAPGVKMENVELEFYFHP